MAFVSPAKRLGGMGLITTLLASQLAHAQPTAPSAADSADSPDSVHATGAQAAPNTAGAIDADPATVAPLTVVPTAPTAPSPSEAAQKHSASPWLDLAPNHVMDHMWQKPNPNNKLAAALTLGGIYAGFTTWTYFAWYRKHKPLSQFRWGGDGLFSERSYAGGADKLGHMWATMGLARAGTELLNQWGGYDRLTSNIIGTALSEALFILIEVKDGFYYEMSMGDLIGDTAGAALAFAMSQWPRFDELFDLRVEYWPSTQYRRQFKNGNINIAEDYSGETYLAALHLGAIHQLRDHRWGTWSRFVDLTVGFGTRGYKPTNPGVTYPREQLLSFGVSLNAQGLFDWLFEGRKSRAARVTRKITHGLFEVFNVPFTSVPVIELKNTATGPVDMGGA